LTSVKNIATPITSPTKHWLIKNTLDLREPRADWSQDVGGPVRSRRLGFQLTSRAIKNKELLKGIWLERNWMSPN
jgi:hypothetical protein